MANLRPFHLQKAQLSREVMKLRRATDSDLPALARLGHDSFVWKFGHLYKAEDLAAFLDEYRTVEKYRSQLADPGTRIMLAEQDSALLGYCLLVLGKGFDERPPPRPGKPASLSQLYCAQGATGKGVGSALMDWAIAEAQGWGADAIQLSVYSENLGAQRFYQRRGFSKVADISFWVGNHRDDEFLYEVRLEREKAPASSP